MEGSAADSEKKANQAADSQPAGADDCGQQVDARQS
jgi:hypothetical protein